MAVPTDKQIELALIECEGMVYVAARRVPCAPNTILSRLQKSPRLQEVLRTAKGVTGDTTELKLFEAIQKGESWAIQFYLKTQCKQRGYTERIDVNLIGAIEAELARLGLGDAIGDIEKAESDPHATSGFIS